jgi:hypothetical protein
LQGCSSSAQSIQGGHAELKSDRTVRQTGEEAQRLTAPQSPVQDNYAGSINAMGIEHILRDIAVLIGLAWLLFLADTNGHMHPSMPGCRSHPLHHVDFHLISKA